MFYTVLPREGTHSKLTAVTLKLARQGLRVC